MNGELDFKAALRERVAMLKGLDLGALEKTWQQIQLTPGARELVATMRAKGALTALVSGGFTFFTGRVAAAAGVRCAPVQRAAGRRRDADRAGRRADPGPRRQAGHVARTGRPAGGQAACDAGCRRRSQRSGHDARGRAGRCVPCQADRGEGGAGQSRPCRFARAAVRPGVSGDRRSHPWC